MRIPKIVKAYCYNCNLDILSKYPYTRVVQVAKEHSSMGHKVIVVFK